MKIEFKELKKALDYIDKHSDKGKITIQLQQQGTVHDCLLLIFTDGSNDSIVISLPTDERAFSKISKTERF